MNLAILPFLLLAGMGGLPPEPKPPKLAAVPEREDELLRPMPALPETPTSYQLATAARHAYRQARAIADYLFGHVAERGKELYLHRLALLDVAERLAATPAISPPLAPPVYDVDPACAKEYAKWVAAHRRDLGAVQELHTVQRPPEPTPAPPRAQPKHIRAPKPAPPPVRCPVKHCQARPGDRCRGHSGEAMDTPHPERVRAFERTNRKE